MYFLAACPPSGGGSARLRWAFLSVFLLVVGLWHFTTTRPSFGGVGHRCGVAWHSLRWCPISGLGDCRCRVLCRGLLSAGARAVLGCAVLGPIVFNMFVVSIACVARRKASRRIARSNSIGDCYRGSRLRSPSVVFLCGAWPRHG